MTPARCDVEQVPVPLALKYRDSLSPATGETAALGQRVLQTADPK